jgi:hypothetical protein
MMNQLQEHHFINATPDGNYALRILQSYRDMCNVSCSDAIDAPPTNPLCIEMNKVNEQRKTELDKAIKLLEDAQVMLDVLKRFEKGDAEGLNTLIKWLDAMQKNSDFFISPEHMQRLVRLQEAAQKMEE